MNIIKVYINKYKSLLRFLIIGGISTSIDFVLYMILSKKIYLYFAKCISMLISMAFSYVGNRLWSFEVKSNKVVNSIFKYIIVQLINLVLNVSVNYLIFNYTNSKIIAFIFATCIAMVVNYILQRKFVFRENI